MTPLGLHHITGPDDHNGPGPWVKNMSRADWTSVYYHKANATGLGFDRTASGSDALEQYADEFADKFSDPDRCPPEFLLWYHHVPWDHQLPAGNSLWGQLCQECHAGAAKLTNMREAWERLAGQVDEGRYQQVLMHLNIQEKEAKWWRDACLTYFQSFTKREIPAALEQPAHDLKYYEALTFPYAPGIKAKW